MKLAHPRALLVALPTWAFSLLWLWPRAVQAEALAKDFRLYDWLSLACAGGLGLAGGVFALIVALATDRRVVREVLGEAVRNALVSPIAGAAAYLALQALVGLGWFQLSTEPRFAAIVACGYAGIAFINWARDTGAKLASGFGEWLVNRGKP